MSKFLYITVLMLTILFFVTNSASASPTITCELTNGACDGVVLFKTYSQFNSHAELPDQTNYNWKVCCHGISSLGNDCLATRHAEVLRLFAPTNSHVEEPGETGEYEYPVCLSASNDFYVTCEYPQDSCSGHEECVASISDVTNAHVSNCTGAGSYPIKVCCEVKDIKAPDISIGYSSSTPGVTSGTWYPSSEAGINCFDTGGCDDSSYRLKIYTSNPGSCPANYDDYDITLSSGSDTKPITQHSWVCGTGKDLYGNIGFTSSPTEFFVDSINPQISDDYSYSDVQTESQTVTISASDSGDSGIKEVKYCEVDLISNPGGTCDPDVDGTAVPECDNPGDSCQFYLTFQDDYKYVAYKVWDYAGNTDNGDFTVEVDTEPPTVNVVFNPESVTSYWQNYDATAGVECSDTVSGCDDTTYKISVIPVDGSKPNNNKPDSCSDVTSWQNIGKDKTVNIDSHSWVCAKATDNVGHDGFSPVMEAKIDKDKPVSQINNLPETTNAERCFSVSWSGDDNEPVGSGIHNYTIEYKISNAGSDNTDWATWLYDTPNTEGDFCSQYYGSDEFVNGGIYCFRVHAKDYADNEEDTHTSYDQCVTIDRDAPECTFDVLPVYINKDEYDSSPQEGFSISWTSQDSDVDYYNISYNITSLYNTCKNSMAWTELVGYYHDTSANVENIDDGCTYYFQCKAVDKAGNIGYSEIVHTTVDITPPSAQIIKPSVEWATDGFSLSWGGSDDVSGIKCYDVQWSKDAISFRDLKKSGYSYTCDTNDKTNVTFDSSVEGVGELNDEDVFYFQVRATDKAGNTGEWNKFWEGTNVPYNVTIDTKPPDVQIVAYDQNGNPITSKVVSSSEVTQITITSTSTDALSGVLHNTINYDLLIGNTRVIDSKECGSASSYGGESSCEQILDYGSDVVLKYQIQSVDRAGNVYNSGLFYVVTHPLTNFVGVSSVITLGDSYILPVQARNLMDTGGEVTLKLNKYPWAKFVDTQEGQITDNGRTITVNLNPDEEKTFFIKIPSILTDELETSEELYVNATTELDTNLKDSDNFFITFSFPPSFPVLDMLAVMIMISMSMLIYWKIKM